MVKGRKKKTVFGPTYTNNLQTIDPITEKNFSRKLLQYHTCCSTHLHVKIKNRVRIGKGNKH